ncbi:hypothetical protein EVAR_9477_1 [Eumeta japonica]|uniref:Uncharacterized protein n=1 Tax=Eumeta variegata TaxID=151549 RepID=A0A4C2A4B4_EUMVA|nr:hypothetical protein EVAR_9477_1 [Eumeta japonica]
MCECRISCSQKLRTRTTRPLPQAESRGLTAAGSARGVRGPAPLPEAGDWSPPRPRDARVSIRRLCGGIFKLATAGGLLVPTSRKTTNADRIIIYSTHAR